MRRGWRARLRGPWLLVLIGGVCVAALVLEVILLNGPASSPPPGSTGFPSRSEVSVIDIDLIPTYDTSSNDTNYLSQSDCGCEPVNVVPGGSFEWWVRFGNSDAANHSLIKVTVDPPFTLTRTFPALPLTLPGGGDQNVSLLIQAPTTGGEYAMTGSAWTA